MRVNLAKSAGFCFGVRRALKIARDTAAKSRNVFMLGDIVHNEDVLRNIEKTGIRKIRKLSRRKDSATLLICAHGAPASIIEKARKLGYRIVDATCPMVKEIHKIVSEMERLGRRVIVIGDQKHDEVRGIIGQLKTRALVVDGADHIPVCALRKIRKAAAVAQSTQNHEKVLNIVEALKAHAGDLKFHNTICRPTRIKQKEMMSMPRQNDVMIIIGSKTSANTRRLYEISKALNKKTYRIGSKEDINPKWFKGARTVGVGAGASTPDAVTRAVVAYLERI